jgi:hypothetical protein
MQGKASATEAGLKVVTETAVQNRKMTATSRRSQATLDVGRGSIKRDLASLPIYMR